MQEIIVSKIDAVLEEGTCLIFVYFLYDFVGLSGEEQSYDVVVDGVTGLLFLYVAH